MARYRPIFVDVWVSDEKFQNYTVEGKLLFLYLITNKHINESGIYRITHKTMANETDIPLNKVKELIKTELSNNVSYDDVKNVIFVHKFLKKSVTGSPHLIKKSIKKDRELIKTTLWKEFDNRYGTDLKPLLKGLITLPSTSISSTSISKSKRKEEYLLSFLEFWNEYPRKKEKTVAFSAWKEHPKKNYRELIVAAGNYRQECIYNKTEERYIKHPATFIRKSKERWKDYLEQTEKPKKTGESRDPEIIPDKIWQPIATRLFAKGRSEKYVGQFLIDLKKIFHRIKNKKKGEETDLLTGQSIDDQIKTIEIARKEKQ